MNFIEERLIYHIKNRISMSWRIVRQWFGIIGFGLLLIILSASIISIEAKTITVDDQGADFVRIQDAINASKHGDTIRVFEGIYFENVVVNNSIHIIGNGSKNTIIRGNPDLKQDVVFITAPYCTISEIGITNSYVGEFHGGIALVSSNNRIWNVSCYENDYGIIIWRCENNTISNTECIINNRSGLYLDKAKFCTFTNITASFQKSGSGAVLENSSHNILKKTNLSMNYKNGVSINNSPNNKFIESTATSNNECGWKIHTSNNIEILSSIASSNQQHGISIFSSNETSISRNNISANQIGIYFLDPFGLSSIENNSITKNTEYGVYISNNLENDIKAENNWWGSNSGPNNEKINPQGTGDKVSIAVNFKPWLTRIMFVDDDAPDWGNGTKKRPYKTISRALRNANSGFTIFINNGTYHENIQIKYEISLIGNGTTNTSLIGIAEDDVIMVTSNKVTISGLNISCNTKSEKVAGIQIRSDQNSISDCEISVPEGCGILLNQSNNNLIVNNYISNSNSGVQLHSSSNNHLHENGFRNISDISISLIDSNSNTLLHNSIIKCGYGIHLERAKTNELRNNLCTNNSNHGLSLFSSEGNTIINNTLSNNEFSGVFFSTSSYNILVETTISENRIGIFAEMNSSHNIIQRNNIVDNHHFGINASRNVEPFNASNNWWGDSSGPFHPNHNTRGKGNHVSDNVIFYPWVISNERKSKTYDYTRTIILILLFTIVIFGIILNLPNIDKVSQEAIIEDANKSNQVKPSTNNISSDRKNDVNSDSDSIFIIANNDDYEIQKEKES